MHGRLLAFTLVVSFFAAQGPAAVGAIHLGPVVDALGPLATAAVSGGQEPDILVDKDGEWVWIADTDGVHRSNDGGATWRHSIPTHLVGAFTDGVALAQDANGALWASSTNGQIIYVQKSVDDGRTWSFTGLAVAVDGVADRPWLATHGNTLAMIYNANGFAERCLLSNDGGTTWISQSAYPYRPNAGNAVFDDAGALYYAVDEAIYRWATPCTLAAASRATPPQGAQILTQLAVPSGPSPPIYVAEPSAGNAQMLIRGYASFFSPTTKQISVTPAQYKSATFGAIDVKRDNSELVVAFYASTTPGNPSASGYPSTAVWDVVVARVTGFWTATPTVTTTVVATGNHVGGFCMTGVTCTTGDRDLLDYMGVAYGPDGRIHVAYGHDGATSTADVRYATLAP